MTRPDAAVAWKSEMGRMKCAIGTSNFCVTDHQAMRIAWGLDTAAMDAWLHSDDADKVLPPLGYRRASPFEPGEEKLQWFTWALETRCENPCRLDFAQDIKDAMRQADLRITRKRRSATTTVLKDGEALTADKKRIAEILEKRFRRKEPKPPAEKDEVRRVKFERRREAREIIESRPKETKKPSWAEAATARIRGKIKDNAPGFSGERPGLLKRLRADRR